MGTIQCIRNRPLLGSFLQWAGMVCAATALTTTVGVRFLREGPCPTLSSKTMRVQRLEVTDSKGRVALSFDSRGPGVYWSHPNVVPEGGGSGEDIPRSGVLRNDASSMLVGIAAPFSKNADLKVQAPGIASPASVNMVLVGEPQSPQLTLKGQGPNPGNTLVLEKGVETTLRIFDPISGTTVFEC